MCVRAFDAESRAQAPALVSVEHKFGAVSRHLVRVDPSALLELLALLFMDAFQGVHRCIGKIRTGRS